MQASNYVRPVRISSDGCHFATTPSSLLAADDRSDTGIKPGERVASAGPSKERTVNTIFNDIADSLSNITTWDDVATGLVCATFCAASASLFVVMFSGAA